MGHLSSPRSAGEGEAEPWGCPMNSACEADSCLQRSPVDPEHSSLHQTLSVHPSLLVPWSYFKYFKGVETRLLGSGIPGWCLGKADGPQDGCGRGGCQTLGQCFWKLLRGLLKYMQSKLGISKLSAMLSSLPPSSGGLLCGYDG